MVVPSIRVRAAAVGVLAWAVLAGAAGAQAYKAPRNAFGQPDLQGVWTNASLTQPASARRMFKSLTITEAEAAGPRDSAWPQIARRRQEPTDPNARRAAARPTIRAATTPSGSIRASSWAASRASCAPPGWSSRPTASCPTAPRAGKPVHGRALRKARTNFDGPEGRPLGERCILGFGSTAGPPMLNVLYNNNYQIVQTKDTWPSWSR